MSEVVIYGLLWKFGRHVFVFLVGVERSPYSPQRITHGSRALCTLILGRPGVRGVRALFAIYGMEVIKRSQSAGRETTQIGEFRKKLRQI